MAVIAESGSTVVIRPRRGLAALKLGDVWAYRELLYFLAWRDVKVRYKQTALGAAWAIIQPLFTMVVFTIFFGRLAKIPSEGFPYPVYTFAALLPWQLFAYALTYSSQSLVAEARLITKVYFPRLVIPISSVLGGLVDFGVAFLILIALMLYYHVVLTWRLVVLPVLLLFAVATALGVGLWLSVLNVKYRDVRYTLPFLAQVWLFASPVAYPASLVPEQWQMIYGLNPMVGVIEGFRWALLGTAPPAGALYASLLLIAVLLGFGLYYFRATERTFADLV